MRVISLSTIPPRFASLGRTLQSLLNQRGRVDEIRLYVPQRYRRFPEYDGAPPAVPEGVKLIRPDDDIGPATKVLFAAQSLWGVDAQILFCDDDVDAPPDWSRRLFDTQQARPDDCVAATGKLIPSDLGTSTARKPRAIRTHLGGPRYIMGRLLHAAGLIERKPRRSLIARSGYVDVLQGYGGAVVRPHFFSQAAFDIPPILWAVDDYWLSGLLAAQGIGIWTPAGIEMPSGTEATQQSSLRSSINDGADRTQANIECIRYMQDHFGVWKAAPPPKRDQS